VKGVFPRVFPRVFLAGGAVGIALMIALVAAGGLSVKREVDYVECERFAVPSAIVRIESSPIGPAWGHPRFIEVSSYGPPYDLSITGTLEAAAGAGAPDGAGAGAIPDTYQITDLIVEADGAALLSLPRVPVRVQSVPVDTGGGSQRSVKGFVYSVPAFTSATPARLRVAGTLPSLAPAAGRDQGQRFAHVFEARHTRRLTLGRWTWSF
jgi:hypothetical protein